MSWLAAMSYGPTPRTVAIQRLVGSGPPEILDSAATIARRTIELSDGFENAGAMLVRATLLHVEKSVGDGSALTAVLLHRLLAESARCLTGGSDPVQLRIDLGAALGCVRPVLAAQARPADEVTSVPALVAGLLSDPLDVEVLAEVLEAVGADGVVLVEGGQSTQTTREYLDGARWEEGYLSPYFINDDSGIARVLQPVILVTDQSIQRAEQLIPLLELCVAAGRRQLLIVAPELCDGAAGLLLANRQRGVLEGVVAVRAPAHDQQRVSILEDLAVLTGAHCLRLATGDRLEGVRAADLGSARQAWARNDAFGILGGAGDRLAIRSRAIACRAELGQVRDNPAERKLLQKRLANLSGVAAVVRVGGVADADREQRSLRSEAAIRAAQLALRDGVVPGGGAALINCAEALTLATPARIILKRALASPMRLLARLAGLEPATLATQVCSHRGESFDVLRRTWTPTLVDPYPVVSAALEASISAAATAMSAEAVVRRRT
jgi:chaperonin GroEL